MNNSAIADHFALLAKLMDIHGENSFKSKSYANASFQIDKLDVQLSEIAPDRIAGIKGIGDSAAKKVLELLSTGSMQALQDMLVKTPAGVVEMLNIKGLGPKKINTVWKEMEVESIGELLYACNENRLTLFKGFGEKTQQNVKESIEFYLGQQGRFLYQQAEAFATAASGLLADTLGTENVHITGAFRRQDEIIDVLEFVVAQEAGLVKQLLQSANGISFTSEEDGILLYQIEQGPALKLYAADGMPLQQRLFTTTGTQAFNAAFVQQFPAVDYNSITSDAQIFEDAGLQYIAPYLRNDGAIIELAKSNGIPALIDTGDIKGIIHSHSTWSDGTHTLEQMANAAAKAGFEYLVISDHSKTAIYAKGLYEERIVQQHAEIDNLNKLVAPFKIYKSIESDILGDGSLDYADDVLASFDMVIASVHSTLKMTEERAMSRLIKAIENPYTTILGHMTGRLLLSRNGYPLDHAKIIDACAANKVVIELNAHPRRLDIDWRWIYRALDKGVLISIDPDAHSIEGYADIKYGVLVAQKGLLTAGKNFSSFGREQLDSYLFERRAFKGI